MNPFRQKKALRRRLKALDDRMGNLQGALDELRAKRALLNELKDNENIVMALGLIPREESEGFVERIAHPDVSVSEMAKIVSEVITRAAVIVASKEPEVAEGNSRVETLSDD